MSSVTGKCTVRFLFSPSNPDSAPPPFSFPRLRSSPRIRRSRPARVPPRRPTPASSGSAPAVSVHHRAPLPPFSSCTGAALRSTRHPPSRSSLRSSASSARPAAAPSTDARRQPEFDLRRLQALLMDALIANYASDSDGDEPTATVNNTPEPLEASALLPPPPLDLLRPPNFVDYLTMAQGSRIRSFPHVEGNYALHVYIPVVIPSDARKQLALVMRRAASLVPDLYAVDADYVLSELCKDEQKLDKVLLGREFHVSLGRTVAIQVHQIDSLVAMLRQKFQSQHRLAISKNFIAEPLMISPPLAVKSCIGWTLTNGSILSMTILHGHFFH